jgi:hypothetical protein
MFFVLLLTGYYQHTIYITAPSVAMPLQNQQVVYSLMHVQQSMHSTVPSPNSIQYLTVYPPPMCCAMSPIATPQSTNSVSGPIWQQPMYDTPPAQAPVKVLSWFLLFVAYLLALYCRLGSPLSKRASSQVVAHLCIKKGACRCTGKRMKKGRSTLSTRGQYASWFGAAYIALVKMNQKCKTRSLSWNLNKYPYCFLKENVWNDFLVMSFMWIRKFV